MTNGPFVGLVYELRGGAAPADRVTFTARAEQPMRISVQLRVVPPTAGESGGSDVYVSTDGRGADGLLRDLVPRASPTRSLPDLSKVSSILFVVDTTNTRPDRSGRFWIRERRRLQIDAAV